MSRKSPKKYKIYKYNYTCNRLPRKNLLKKNSEIDFSSGDILTSKKSRFQRILNRVRGKKKREISPSYFITPWLYIKDFKYLLNANEPLASKLQCECAHNVIV